MATKNIVRISSILLLLVLSFIWLVEAMDYGDSVAAGTYHFARGGEASTLVLSPDHTFKQQLTRSGQTSHAEGTWRRLGEGGINFSKDFLVVSGDEPEPDGTTFSELRKTLGLFPSLALRQYHVLWYGKTDSSPDKSVYGTYTGDEPGVPATLILKPNNTFEQNVKVMGTTKQTEGTWSSKNGTIFFSKEFIKTSGEQLKENETASASGPLGSDLQIEVAITRDVGEPIFRKRLFTW
jgi:hypothetical protein